jgi:hypothetical protein
MDISQSMKAIAAIVVSAAAALTTALSGFGSDAGLGDLDLKTWLIAIVAILGSGGLTWWVENVHGTAAGIIKTITAFLTAGIASLVVALDDSVITQAEWLVAFSAAALATGLVYQAKGPQPATNPS